MVFNREEAAIRATVARGSNNTPGMCQAWTRGIFGVHAVGDVDGDKDADAVDGWKSEPLDARHPGDRNPPRGVPVAWSGGSNGYGHRAVSLGKGRIASTDAAGTGRIGIVDLDWFERNWGMKYLGWSETMSGVPIPLPPKPKKTSRGYLIDKALRLLKKKKSKTKKGTPRRRKLREAIRKLKSIRKTK